MNGTDGPEITSVTGRVLCGHLILFTLFGGVIVALAPQGILPKLVRHVPLPGVVAYLALVAIAVTAVCLRGWRMALLLDQRGVTVRNYLRTYRFGWHEVSCLTDGSMSAWGSDGFIGRQWVLRIRLRNGRTVTASGTVASGRHEVAEMLAIIRRAAGRYAIPTDLTGEINPQRFV